MSVSQACNKLYNELVLLAGTTNTSYTSTSVDLSKYRFLILSIATYGSTRMLASTIIDKGTAKKCINSSLCCSVVYGEEPTNYKGSAYFNSSLTTVYLQNSSNYSITLLYGF